MRSHRIYIPESLKVGSQFVLDGKAAHYLSRVLRLAEDTQVIMFNGDGHDYRCNLFEFRRDKLKVAVLERLSNHAESPLRITLTQAMSRGDRMDYSLQKATELGVSVIQLLVTERVELKLAGDRLEKRLGHWHGVIQSASEQCGRATVPQLRGPIPLSEWIGLSGQKLVLDSSGELQLSQVSVADSVDIAVGPEGGFTDAEKDFMGRSGAQFVSLGPRTLRTETAGPAAIAVLQSIGGDF